MRRALAVIVAMSSPAFADDPKPNPNIVVDATVHETPVLPSGTLDAPVHATPVKSDKDRAASRAENANVFAHDPREGRQGFFLHSGIGPSVTIGGGTGTGGGGTLMLGTTMGRTLVGLVAFTVNAQRHEVMKDVHTNDYSTVGMGMQWWPSNGALHVRGTLGIGGYRCKQCVDPDHPTDPVLIDYDRRGVNGTFAVGIDLYRTSFGLVWGLDTSAIFTVHSDPGVITALGFQSYLSVD
jgi:hypothetical protein